MSPVASVPITASLPPALAELLAEAGLRDVVQWWRELDLPSQRQVCQLWADCAAAYAGQRIVACVEAEFVEMDGLPTADGAWHSDFYEYLVNHEELYFEERVFHVCTRHPKIIAAIQNGLLPASFTCGLDASACPAKRLLDLKAGRSVRLRLAFRPAA